MTINNKIMIAILDDGYYDEHHSYPEEYNNDYANICYTFNTLEEFVEKWHELDEGVWYWVFVNGKEICSGAVDPDDINIFEEYFNMSFEEE